MARYFNKNLKYIRLKRKISQQELANKLKIDRSTISRWENDEMDITVGNAILIANFFDIPLEDFTSKDLSLEENNNSYDKLEQLFKKNKDILNEDEKEKIEFIIEKRKKEKNKS